MRLASLLDDSKLVGDSVGSKGATTVTGFAIDHRHVTPGMIFGAFKGSHANGENYIAAAVAAGAIAIVADPSASGAVAAAGAVHIADSYPRRAFAYLAAEFYAPYPPCCVGVTGTNGKSSTVDFLRQIWALAGYQAATIGTLGVRVQGREIGTGAASAAVGFSNPKPSPENFAPPSPAILTTPDIVSFLSMMAQLARDGVTHAAFEASSHGLDQYRTAGLPVTAGAFTNFSRDHLDYHESMEQYFSAKMRLFRDIVDAVGTAVIWNDDPYAAQVIAIAKQRGLQVITVGHTGADIRLVRYTATRIGQDLLVAADGKEYRIFLPLIGNFQAANALIAAGLAIASGGDSAVVLPALSQLQSVSGRLQCAAITTSGVPIYVDYAHTAEALAVLLEALRPHVARRLILVFGAGGNRDQGKRRAMGQAAAKADIILITDDNPRGEDAAEIRRTIRDGLAVGIAIERKKATDTDAIENLTVAIPTPIPELFDIGDRRSAIAMAIARAETGDLLCIAGKGHEQGQIIGVGRDARVLPFDDVAVVCEILAEATA